MDDMAESYDYNILGENYPLPQIEDKNATKEQILINATLLFAKHGYASVSMRDIANSIGIKPASLYNHFESKETLWQAVIDHAKDLYLLYFRRLNEALERAETFSEALEVMFLEPKKLTNIFTCYAFSLMQTEQFRDARVAEVFNETCLKYSIEFIEGWFRRCIEKGLAPEFDAGTVATFFMHSVLIGLNVKVQECLERPIPYDPSTMFEALQTYILRTVEKEDQKPLA